MASTMLATSLLVTPQWALQNQDSTITIRPEAVVVDACQADSKGKECVLGLIKKWANIYDVPVDLAVEIADCESELKVDAVGDSGKAYGVYQFHKPTFKEFSEKLGVKLDYMNTEDNVRLAMWGLANEKGHHWSCYRKIAER